MNSPTLTAVVRRHAKDTTLRLLAALADEIRRNWPHDPEARAMTKVIEKKARRLSHEN